MNKPLALGLVASLWVAACSSETGSSSGGGGSGATTASSSSGATSGPGGAGATASSTSGAGAGGAAASTAGAGGATAAQSGSGGAGGALACPPVGPLDCTPGSGTGEADQCTKDTSCFLGDVKSAVLGVVQSHPEWFDYNNPNNCPFILQIDPFMDGVVANLLALGDVCAIRDPNAPNEEVTVKHDNAYSENFDIVAANGCARYGDLIYTSTCAPAWW